MVCENDISSSVPDPQGEFTVFNGLMTCYQDSIYDEDVAMKRQLRFACAANPASSLHSARSTTACFYKPMGVRIFRGFL